MDTAPVNHVFVDFENVPAFDFTPVEGKAVHFTLLVGARQTKIDTSIVEKLLAHATPVELVRLTTGGPNALDITLAYYIGRAANADPTGYFHIVSKDRDYDPLIEHLKSRHIHARRHDDFTSLTFGPTKIKPEGPIEPFARALEHLRKNSTNRPKRKKTLCSHLLALFASHLSPVEVEKLIQRLQQAKHLVIDGKGAITYQIDVK